MQPISKAQMNNQQHTKLAYCVCVVLCLLQIVINGVASAQMQVAQDSAGENTLVVCTGKGMVYINESLFLELGEIEYLDVDDAQTASALDTNIASSCIYSAQSDNPQHELVLDQASAEASTYAINNFTLKQQNYLRDAYLSSLSRAPPTDA